MRLTPSAGQLHRPQHLHVRAGLVRPGLRAVRVPARLRLRHLRKALRVPLQRGLHRTLLRQACVSYQLLT